MEKSKHNQEMRDEIQDIAPGLARLPDKKKADDIPFHYFEKLGDQVIQKIQDQSRDTLPHLNWLDRLITQWYSKRYLVFAMASVLGVITIGSLWFMSHKSTVDIDFTQIHPLEARTYLLSCASDLDDAQLSLLNDQALEGDFMPVTDEELEGIIDDYLYQIPSETQLN